MQLVETPDNCAPDHAHVARVVARDGIAIRAAHWFPHGRRAKGTVCILQGRAEFIEKYFETIGELLARGFAVVAFDWRGQGFSGRTVEDRRKGHVRSFRHYGRDLEAVHEQVLAPLMPRPHFALAHSMGGAIAFDLARSDRLPFERMVTTAPMIALSMVRHHALASGAARALTLLGFGSAYVPGGGATSIATKPFAGNPLTSDARRYARNAEAAAALAAGAVGDPTIAWVAGAYGLMGRLAERRAPVEIRVPALVVAAGADAVCDTPAIERFAARLKAGRIVTLPGARHEILMESDTIREDFWAAFDAFVPGTRLEASIAGEELKGRRVHTAIAGGDDVAP